MRKKLKGIQTFVKKHDGYCISTEYVNNHTKMIWLCKNGHCWSTTWQCVQKGTWCPICSQNKQRLLLSEAQEEAKKHNGECLSETYINILKKLTWKCKNGHVWEASLNNIKYQKQWCPYCANRRLNIKDMQNIAKNNFGKCLSKKYINSKKKLLWECYNGHRWYATPPSIMNAKSWCPHCKASVGENVCRIIFETIYNEKFKKIRPQWLTNNDGYRLELDGYCENLNLAFEYNGPQHYKNTFFNKNGEYLKKIKEHDKIKRIKCMKKNIKLVVINYEPDIYKLIQNVCSELNAPYLDPAKIVKNIKTLSRLNECHLLAKQKGGKCLSKKYINSQTKLKWKCKNGHVWEATSNTVKNGHWCRKCNMKTLEDMVKIAKGNNGYCLSKKYNGMLKKLTWKCKNGHIWDALPVNIVHGKTWCPKCRKRK